MRTVLMTALLAALGLLPMAFSHGIGSETQKPLAVVIIGGLATATVLVLVVMPVLYLVAARRETSETRLGRKVALAAAAIASSSCASMHLGSGGMSRPPELVGEWIDLRHATPADTSLWVLRADGYDGTAHLRASPGPDGSSRTETRYGGWYFRGKLADPADREICFSRRVARFGATCLKFDLDTLRDAAGERRRLTIRGYAGQHTTGTRQLIERLAH
jgi:hypothetical protein